MLGKLAIELTGKLDTNSSHPSILYIVGNLISHWTETLWSTIPAMEKVHFQCLEEGDFEVAANALYSSVYRQFFNGSNLTGLQQRAANDNKTFIRLGHKIPHYRFLIFNQTINNLTTEREDPSEFSGNYYSVEAMTPLHTTSSDNTSLFLVHLMQAYTSFIYNNYEKAVIEVELARKFINSVTSSLFIPVYYFYSTLIYLAVYTDLPPVKKLGARLFVRKSIRLLKHWSDHCPENYLGKYNLVMAMKLSVFGGQKKQDYFSRAIEESKKQGFPQDMALTYELLGLFHLKKNRKELGLQNIKHAYLHYHNWGAIGKAEQLKRTYHHGFKEDAIDQTKTVPQGLNEMVDIDSIIKATRTLSETIYEKDLLQSLLKILIENAAAQSGYLFFQTDDVWQPRAEGELLEEGIDVSSISPEEERMNLPINIIHYVVRTQKSVVLHNACREGLFIRDPYVIRNQPKSILCTPILHQGLISCIVYLENNLTVGAFPTERQEVISILGSHAAISLKNSNLYSKLEKTIEQLHQEIDKRKEAQVQLLHAEKLAALGRLSASIAHEFGNPLIGIQYLLQDIEERFSFDKDDLNLLKVSIDECHRMKTLIKDMQQLHRPTSGKKEIFDLHSVLDKVLLFQKKNLTSNKILLEKKYGTQVSGIYGVEDQITQVFVNITLNSVDSMSGHGGILRVSTEKTGDNVLIQIQDTGVGVSYEDQKNIFEPFFSTKPNVEGTGLGLPISYSIIKNHNGNISFSSKLGQGCCFSISLPISDK